MPEAETLSSVISDALEKKAYQLLEKACEADLSLATAESCTGGMIASLLTDVPGASHAFERGFITYTHEAKAEMLGVSEDLLERRGAVTREVAIAMAEGALERSRADIALSVTGYAGGGKEPGLVHFACARAGRKTAHRAEHFGDIGRGRIRIACMEVAIDMITDML